MITAEVAIISDVENRGPLPRDEICAGLDMVSAIGGVALVPRAQEYQFEFRVDCRNGLNKDEFAEGVSSIWFPAPLNVLYTNKRIYGNGLPLVYGFACKEVGLMVVSSFRAYKGHMRGDTKQITAHETGHVLNIQSTTPATDGFHCLRPDCTMSPYAAMAPIDEVYLTPLIEDDIIEETFLPPAAVTLANDFCLGCKTLARTAAPSALEGHIRRYESAQK